MTRAVSMYCTQGLINLDPVSVEEGSQKVPVSPLFHQLVPPAVILYEIHIHQLQMPSLFTDLRPFIALIHTINTYDFVVIISTHCRTRYQINNNNIHFLLKVFLRFEMILLASNIEFISEYIYIFCLLKANHRLC